MQATENSNEWIDWINDAITKKLIKYYEYDYFYNIEEIGSGSFGKVYRANWKNSEQYLVLKSFFLFVGIARSYYTIFHDYLHLLAHKNGNCWNCDKPFKR